MCQDLECDEITSNGSNSLIDQFHTCYITIMEAFYFPNSLRMFISGMRLSDQTDRLCQNSVPRDTNIENIELRHATDIVSLHTLHTNYEKIVLCHTQDTMEFGKFWLKQKVVIFTSYCARYLI